MPASARKPLRTVSPELTAASRKKSTATDEAADKRIKATEEVLTSSKLPASTAVMSSDKPAREAGPTLKQREKEYSEANNRAIASGETGAEAAKTATRLQKKYNVGGIYNPAGPSASTTHLKGTPAERQAARTKLQKAKKVVAEILPGLSGAQRTQRRSPSWTSRRTRSTERPDQRPDGDTEQESNFDPAAVSSAGAIGATNSHLPRRPLSMAFTLARSKKAVRSEVFGQAHLTVRLDQPVRLGQGSARGLLRRSFSALLLGSPRQSSEVHLPRSLGQPRRDQELQGSAEGSQGTRTQSRGRQDRRGCSAEKGCHQVPPDQTRRQRT